MIRGRFINRLGHLQVLVIAIAMVLTLSACDSVRRTPATPTPLPFVGPDIAAQNIGQEVRVRMRIECADAPVGGKPTYLRSTCYYEGFFFRLVIPPEKLPEFEQAVNGKPEQRMVDRVVDVRGVVQRNGQWSEIVLDSTEQVKISATWSNPRVPTRIPTPES